MIAFRAFVENREVFPRLLFNMADPLGGGGSQARSPGLDNALGALRWPDFLGWSGLGVGWEPPSPPWRSLAFPQAVHARESRQGRNSSDFDALAPSPAPTPPQAAPAPRPGPHHRESGAEPLKFHQETPQLGKRVVTSLGGVQSSVNKQGFPEDFHTQNSKQLLFRFPLEI